MYGMMFTAALYDDWQNVFACLDKGLSVDPTDDVHSCGRTLLDWAYFHCHDTAICMLIKDYDADLTKINWRQIYCFMFNAADAGEWNNVYWYLQQGLNVNAKDRNDPNQRRLLNIAFKQRDNDVINTLIKHYGADIQLAAVDNQVARKQFDRRQHAARLSDTVVASSSSRATEEQSSTLVKQFDKMRISSSRRRGVDDAQQGKMERCAKPKKYPHSRWKK